MQCSKLVKKQFFMKKKSILYQCHESIRHHINLQNCTARVHREQNTMLTNNMI